MACWVRQFHGLEELTGCDGIIDLRTGEVTGEALEEDVDEVDDDDKIERFGLDGSSGTGGRRWVVDELKLPKILLLAGRDEGGWAPTPTAPPGRISTRAPAWSNARKTSLLPRATATWIGNRPLKSGVSIEVFAWLWASKIFDAFDAL